METYFSGIDTKTLRRLTERMETSTYKGDSPNKKMVRALAWLHAIDVLKEFHQEPKGAYVLAGHGGDIRTLKGAVDYMYPRESDFLGEYPIKRHPEKWLHRPKDIGVTAVDFDQTLIDGLHNRVGHISSEKESGIGSIEGYVGDASRLVSKAGEYNMSHMDFCNATSVDNIYTVGEVIRNSTGLSYHMVTVMRGRECGPRRHDILVPDLSRVERKRWKRHLTERWKKHPSESKVAARILTRGMFDVKSAIKEVERSLRSFVVEASKIKGNTEKFLYFKKDGSLTPYGTGIVRASLFVELLTVMLHDTHAVTMVYSDSYQSNISGSNGTPFTTFGLLALPIKDCISIPGVKYSSEFPLELSGDVEKDATIAWSVLDQLRCRASTMNMSGSQTALYHGTKFSEEVLRINACLLAMRRDSESSSDLLCLDKRSVAAWRAHATRGSYGKWLSEIAEQYALPFGHPDRPRGRWFLPADKTKYDFY